MIRLKLDEYLNNHKITRYELAKRTSISFQIIDRYYKNQLVRYDSDILDRICIALDCDICDLIEYQKSENQK
ncbi:MAG: helix-turn-helix transcriptional regulator [Ruminococcaceae bacterium]|nr:helix-turn-helix transcriptional regulator [Oscillospiraceae bacterium]